MINCRNCAYFRVYWHETLYTQRWIDRKPKLYCVKRKHRIRKPEKRKCPDYVSKKTKKAYICSLKPPFHH